MNKPTIEEWFILISAQISPRAVMRLLEAFSSISNVYSATKREWVERAQLTPLACDRLLKAINTNQNENINKMNNLGIKMIPFTDNEYPAVLRTIPDPPVALFVLGNLSKDDWKSVGIVGSRRASPYGRHVASELAFGLVKRGFTIVSGLALGADAAAHEGAIQGNGRTIAVLGCGVDIIYPPENYQLYDKIAATGAVISEYIPGTSPNKSHFPQRNRIISGLSLGTVVVEAPEKSGALITASHAIDQGREVFAVPGSINSIQSRGTHNLLRDGATLVESAAQIAEELEFRVQQLQPKNSPIKSPSGPDWNKLVGEVDNTATEVITRVTEIPKPERKRERPETQVINKIEITGDEKTVADTLSNNAIHVDEIIIKSGLPSSKVNSTLIILELKGVILRQPGNQYLRIG
ncbi:MAG: DNA-processing protein DprA [bacterium]